MKTARLKQPTANLLSAVLVLLLLAFLSGCSSESSKPAEQAKPEPKGPELLTARSAFQKLYVAARGWNLDAKPYRIESVTTSDGNGHDGKWAVWRASFASANARAEKSYTWSGSTADGAPSRGISPGTEDSYSPSNASTTVFDMAFLKIDSDQAAETAQKHGGDKVLEKSPNTPISFVCDWNHNTNELIWHVIYGPNREGAKLTVSVNASTGEFLRVEK
jgi:curli biogenesis system outer membrane secretion channel CsgG